MVARRIAARVGALAIDYETGDVRQLTGNLKGHFRARVGDWRIIFHMTQEEIVIMTIGHRRDIYKRVNQVI